VVLLTALAGLGLAATAATARPMPPPPTPPPPAPGVAPGATVVPISETLVEMYYTATDGTVWDRDVEPGAAAPPVPVSNGRLVSAPVPIWTGSAGIVFGQGPDNQLWYSQENGTWGSLGGKLTAKPGAVFRGPAAADYSVYVRSTDGAVWARDHSASGWNAWHFIGGQVLPGTGPAAAASSVSGPVLAVVGTDRHIYLYGRTGTESSFVDFGGQTSSSPGLTFASNGGVSTMVVFARGTGNAAWYRPGAVPLSPTGAWHSIGGRLTSGVAAASVPGGDTYAFGLGTDGQVYDASGAYPAFGGWGRLTG
jgi:hypothetical protein